MHVAVQLLELSSTLVANSRRITFQTLQLAQPIDPFRLGEGEGGGEGGRLSGGSRRRPCAERKVKRDGNEIEKVKK